MLDEAHVIGNPKVLPCSTCLGWPVFCYPTARQRTDSLTLQHLPCRQQNPLPPPTLPAARFL